MQSVKKKTHKQLKHRRLLGLLGCALLLAGCVTAAVQLRKTETAETAGTAEVPEHITGAITRRKSEDLKSLTVVRRGEVPWTLVRDTDEGIWLNADGMNERPVSESIGERLEDASINLTYEDVFTENRADWEANAADFGLDNPRVTARICFADDSEVTVRIGNSADPDNDAYYYMTVDGDDRLYAVAAGTLQDLDVARELLYAVPQLQIHSALLDRITVLNGDGSIRTEWALEGQITDRDAAENWTITVPFIYPADYDTMKNLRESAEKLFLGVYMGRAADETLADFGLDRPAAELRLHMAEGSTGTVGASGVYDVTDWEEREIVLTLGGKKSEMTDYVRYGDEVYTISHFSISSFTETDPLSTAARYPVATPLDSLESMMVEQEGAETVHYALIRPDGEAGASDNNRCLRNGEEIHYEIFAAAYERLLTVTASGKLPEGYQPKETHKKYTFRTVSGRTHTVELSDYDGMHDAVTMDGHTLFYLIRDGMTPLP